MSRVNKNARPTTTAYHPHKIKRRLPLKKCSNPVPFTQSLQYPTCRSTTNPGPGPGTNNGGKQPGQCSTTWCRRLLNKKIRILL
ncbi:hypothetical protein pipiens_019928 [Culex pipiens pipiens]|uniref:Uncharacterized protein n=1 Tax=Culex pipiens pipiens TaxID=38569 RepID=A0ABD1DR05_CULPP